MQFLELHIAVIFAFAGLQFSYDPCITYTRLCSPVATSRALLNLLLSFAKLGHWNIAYIGLSEVVVHSQLSGESSNLIPSPIFHFPSVRPLLPFCNYVTAARAFSEVCNHLGWIRPLLLVYMIYCALFTRRSMTIPTVVQIASSYTLFML